MKKLSTDIQTKPRETTRTEKKMKVSPLSSISKTLLATCALCASATLTSQATMIYFSNDAGDGLWGTAGNWSTSESSHIAYGTIPQAADDAVVPSGKTVSASGYAAPASFTLGGTVEFDNTTWSTDVTILSTGILDAQSGNSLLRVQDDAWIWHEGAAHLATSQGRLQTADGGSMTFVLDGSAWEAGNLIGINQNTFSTPDADFTWAIDVGSFVGTETFEVMDFGSNTAGWTAASFQTFNLQGGTWAFDEGTGIVSVTVSVVPEPSSLALLGMGFALMMTMRRRRS